VSHDQTVLVKTQAVHAVVGDPVGRRGGQTVGPEGQEVKADLALQLLRVRKAGDGPEQRRVVTGIEADDRVVDADGTAQIRRVDALKQPG
jgi:hypothetical protein